MGTFKVMKRPRCWGRRPKDSYITATEIKEMKAKNMQTVIIDELEPLTEEVRKWADVYWERLKKDKHGEN